MTSERSLRDVVGAYMLRLAEIDDEICDNTATIASSIII